MKSTLGLFLSGAWITALVACGTPPPPVSPGGEVSPPSSGVVSSPPASGTTAPDAPPPGKGPVCKLPAPKKSADDCKTDADCGVSEPCHARECVAKSKSHPPTADQVCTMMLACNSADANHCGCFEGKCALIPPPDKE